jgi:thiamine biosynthesis lipoprotein
MKPLAIITLGCFLLVLCSGSIPPGTRIHHQYISRYEGVLGTSLEIKISTVSALHAKAAENAALNEIDRLNKIMSGYDSSSEVSLWLHGDKKTIKLSPELFTILSLFDKWHVRTGGALDASSEVVSRVWKDAAIQNKQPTTAQLSEAIQIVKQTHWKLDQAEGTALHLDEAPIVLNSFVKSYIISKACDAAMAAGAVTGVVVNIGGDIVVRGEHAEQVQVADPKADAENDAPIAMLSVTNKAVATSGNYRRGEVVNGRWHSHIVDPRTGLPADKVISATVIADDATDAGALATAINILTPGESEALVASMPHAEFMLITSDGKRFESKGWKKMEEHKIIPAKKISFLPDQTLDPNYELLIKLELSEIEGIRVHRPYVAVWVVDKNKKPVRSIALWYNKPRYLNDMRAWYEDYYSNFTGAGSSISSTTSATRPAGKYTLKWDGRNDKGQMVNAGTYTLMIEVAREHGTHQLMTSQLDFTQKIKPVTLPGNVEVTSASLEYIKKTNG